MNKIPAYLLAIVVAACGKSPTDGLIKSDISLTTDQPLPGIALHSAKEEKIDYVFKYRHVDVLSYDYRHLESFDPEESPGDLVVRWNIAEPKELLRQYRGEDLHNKIQRYKNRGELSIISSAGYLHVNDRDVEDWIRATWIRVVGGQIWGNLERTQIVNAMLGVRGVEPHATPDGSHIMAKMLSEADTKLLYNSETDGAASVWDRVMNLEFAIIHEYVHIQQHQAGRQLFGNGQQVWHYGMELSNEIISANSENFEKAAYRIAQEHAQFNYLSPEMKENMETSCAIVNCEDTSVVMPNAKIWLNISFKEGANKKMCDLAGMFFLDPCKSEPEVDPNPDDNEHGNNACDPSNLPSSYGDTQLHWLYDLVGADLAYVQNFYQQNPGVDVTACAQALLQPGSCTYNLAMVLPFLIQEPALYQKCHEANPSSPYYGYANQNPVACETLANYLTCKETGHTSGGGTVVNGGGTVIYPPDGNTLPPGIDLNFYTWVWGYINPYNSGYNGNASDNNGNTGNNPCTVLASDIHNGLGQNIYTGDWLMGCVGTCTYQCPTDNGFVHFRCSNTLLSNHACGSSQGQNDEPGGYNTGAESMGICPSTPPCNTPP